MTKEMVISTSRHETKVAVLEDDQLVEVYFQRANEYSLAGSIHKGRVTRVLPGMQSAFVDLGLERDTFLYVSDFFEENEEFDSIPPERERRPPREDRPRREESKETPVQEAAVAVDEPPAEPAAEMAEVGPEAGAAAEPAVADRGNRPGPDRAEFDRDRHRRSRRRRNRGRGFPESKYASPSHTPVPRPAAEPVEPAEAEPESAAPASEFSILPGESLAKYRHTAVSSLDSGELEELGAASPEAEHTAEQAMPDEAVESETVPEVAQAAQPAIEPAPDPAPESGPERDAEPEPEPAEMEPVAARPPEPDPSEVVVEEAARTADAEALVTEESEVDELVAEALAEAAESFEPEPGAEAEAERDALPDVATENEAVFAEHDEIEGAATSETESAPAASAPTEPVEASVRENSGRYIQHRISRRMRRRMRSQGRGEGEPRREGEAAPPAATELPKSEIQPEIRSEVRPETKREARPESRPDRGDTRAAARPEKGGTPSITDLLKEGQEILVQIAKEPLGQKGARITSHIALPGRYVVYMPTLEHMGVSRKIASDEERARLKRILQAHHTGIQGGFIVRTAGEGKTEEDIASDMDFLANLWIDIRQKAETRPAPALLHHDLDIVQRLLRDQLTENFKAIWVDAEEVYERILRFVQRFQPALVTRVKLYTRPAPIFDAFNITSELEKALRPKVWLKSGGYIVINQTEALVAVDVNTGKFVGKSNRLEDTIVKTNTEAVKEIVRQIRLRDLGGIIVVDFIDMDERKNRQKVMQALEEAMRADKAPYKILQFNDFGLVAITRKRVKQSLERALCTPCPYCDGAGYVKSVQTIVGEILQEAQKIAPAVEGENNVILRVNPEVAKTLKSNQNRYLEELESILRRPVLVKSDNLLHHEKFDLA